MKERMFFLAATLACIVVSSAAIEPAFAAKSPKLNGPKSFQAHFILQEGSNPPEQGTMYYSHGRIREEMKHTEDGPRAVTIIDPVSRKIYLIEADKKAFKVLPWDSKSALITEALRRTGKRKLVGIETIDGQECENLEIQPKDSGIKPFHVWLNTSTHFPVQLATEESDLAKGIKIKWTDLRPGNQAAILFDPPLGYQEAR
jgi:hypothetical protein